MLFWIIIAWLAWSLCRPRYGGMFWPMGHWYRRPPMDRRDPWMGGFGRPPMGGFHRPPMGGFGGGFGGGGRTMGGGAGRGRR